MVRLVPKVQNFIVQAVKKNFGDTAQVWVFGSRADDTKFGGDIDLYIETDRLSHELIVAKAYLRQELWNFLGEQKIDIVTRSRNQEIQPFQVIAKQTGVELHLKD